MERETAVEIDVEHKTKEHLNLDSSVLEQDINAQGWELTNWLHP